MKRKNMKTNATRLLHLLFPKRLQRIHTERERGSAIASLITHQMQR